MQKQPNPTMKHNQDWTEIDLEALPADFIPATAYQPKQDAAYKEDYAKWEHHGDMIPSSNFYRIAWREMAATTGFRTLYPALLPEGATHVHTINSACASNDRVTVETGAFMSSFLLDFFVRSSGSSHIFNDIIGHLPVPIVRHDDAFRKEKLNRLREEVTYKYLRLNCLSTAFAPVWESVTKEKWTPDTPLRTAEERRAAQNEIDAIVAHSLGITADELCMIYRTQFPVMRRYDQEDRYDSNGRKVPKEIVRLDERLGSGVYLSEADRTWVHPQSGVSYVLEYPFRVLDREADLRHAFKRFQRH